MLSLCVSTFWFYKELLLKWLSGLNQQLFSTQQQMNIAKVTSNPLLKQGEELTNYAIHLASKHAEY